MYLLVDEGDGLVLKNTLTSGSGPTVAGSISYEFAQPQSIKDIVLVAVPSSNSKTIRMSTYEITKAVATNKVATPTFEPIDGTTFDESLIVKATVQQREHPSITRQTVMNRQLILMFLRKRGSPLLKLLPLRLLL